MKNIKIYESLKKLTLKDFKNIAIYMVICGLMGAVDGAGLVGDIYNGIKGETNNTNSDSVVAYTLPTGYTLGENHKGYKEYVSYANLTSYVDKATGKTVYTAPEGYTIENGKAVKRTVEVIEPTIVRSH